MRRCSPTRPLRGMPISIQKDRCAFLVFDEEIKKKMEAGFDFLSVVFPFMRIEDFGKGIRNALEKDIHTCLWRTPSRNWPENGIDAEGLKKTVGEYNRSCEEGMTISSTRTTAISEASRRRNSTPPGTCPAHTAV